MQFAFWVAGGNDLDDEAGADLMPRVVGALEGRHPSRVGPWRPTRGGPWEDPNDTMARGTDLPCLDHGERGRSW